jgi:hypothetical protein
MLFVAASAFASRENEKNSPEYDEIPNNHFYFYENWVFSFI